MREFTDFNRKEGRGIRLRYVPIRDIFQIHVYKQGAWEGVLKDIWVIMLWDLDIKKRELVLALSEMKKNHHLVADFDIFGNFICTFED